MAEKEKKTKGISRRDFLKDAGLLVGGTAIGSTVLLAACGGDTTTETVTATQTSTVTSTVGGATVTETTTVTQSKFVDPIDGMEFDTLAELQAHFEAEHGESITDLTTLTVNGNQFVLGNLKPCYSLAWVIREHLGLFGTKTGCNRGECGTCTVIMNGKSVYSCVILAVEADGAEITTVEGLSDSQSFSGIQKAILDNDSLQCGFCAPGFIMSAQALLGKNSNPTRDEVREALSGHICTCGNTHQYVEAVLKA
jgi:aerobic-type carbon monoxide dehydrogenase small subunit (CoxS/CutS family)